MHSLLLLALSALLLAEPAAPSMDQLNALMREQKYQEVLRGVSKCLALRGAASQPYNRYELFALRGEAYLQTKSNAQAAESFASAAKATDDANQQSVARATELLIKRSRPGGYVPKTTTQPSEKAAGNTPIAIQDPEQRKAAFAALLDDELVVAGPKLKAATASNSLMPVIDAAKILIELRALEFAATGSSPKTKQIGERLGKHAHKLIDSALQSTESRIEQVWRSGSRTRNRVDRDGIVQEKLYGMMGLTSVESNDLKNAIATCEKIVLVANGLADVTGGTELTQDATTAQRLHDRAQEVLTYDYNNEGRDTRKSQTPPTPKK